MYKLTYKQKLNHPSQSNFDSAATVLNTATIEEPELEMADLPVVEEEENQAPSRKAVPAVGDFVKLAAVVGKFDKIFYGSVSVFLVFNDFTCCI